MRCSTSGGCQESNGLPVARLTACALIAVATFLPWATFAGIFGVSWKPTRAIEISTAATTANSSQEFVAVGWASITTVHGIDLPNWLVLAASVFVVGYALMERVPGTNVPRWLPVLLGLYALLHLVTFASPVLLDKRSGLHNLSVGWWLAFLSTLAMLVTLFRWRRKPVPLIEVTAAEGEV